MSRAALSPVNTGLRGRCPRCGEGSVFVGVLKYAARCEACGEDFNSEDAGDGPAVFVIFIVGIFIIPLALAFQLILNVPTWLMVIIWTPILAAICVGLLRVLRGVMLNVQWSHRAREVKSSDVSAAPSDPRTAHTSEHSEP